MTLEQAKRNLEFANYIENDVPDDKFDMRNWFAGDIFTCGSVTCLAGHAIWWPPYVELIKEYYKDRTVPSPYTLVLHSNLLEDIMGDDTINNRVFYQQEFTKVKALEAFRDIVYRNHPKLMPN